MSSERETIEIVDRLLELTQNAEISWEAREVPYTLRCPDTRIELVYVTLYLGKNIRLYSGEYKHYTDESEFHWSGYINLEFTDDEENILWSFPRTSNTLDLLRSVQYENAQVSDFYKEMFGKKT